MRRRDHERIVAELHRDKLYLQRQNDDLLNRLMHVSGSTWTPPPPSEDLPLPEALPDGYSWSPEQDLDAVE